ncbi:hypothetical protein ACLKMH_01915 [Psychromonas sp. KJ10-10]|uniref:hypothetical protein n=1 Tax=Psychromonas sp. KJ10-10 TaxID=3391823 RepID=UPI0039B4CDD8
MKYKILSAVIATALLNGCGGSDPSTTVQAYDPAVANMSTSYVCADGSMGDAGLTDGYGNATITNNTFATNTSTCELTFVGGADAIDMSNGKSMAGVTYNVPRGMAVNGQKVAGSPTSTLLYKILGGADYDETTATQLLTDLGLGDLLNDGVSLSELFLDPELASNKNERNK